MSAPTDEVAYMEILSRIEKRLDKIERDLHGTNIAVTQTHVDIAYVRQIVEDIAPEVKPQIEAILESPLGRMIVGRKKRV